MYIPKVNEEKRVPVMHQMIAAHPLAALVTMGASGLIASHIPMVLEDDGSPFGVLKGHIARANMQWRGLAPAVDALAIFSGPHHYISASWYPGTEEHGKEVPTWNYVVVHAYGPLKIIEDAPWLMAHLEGLTDQVEETSEKPWKLTDAPEEYIHALLKGIVGLELPIQRLEGKWKVSQNRNARDQKAVQEELDRLNTPESLTMKELVAGKRP